MNSTYPIRAQFVYSRVNMKLEVSPGDETF